MDNDNNIVISEALCNQLKLLGVSRADEFPDMFKEKLVNGDITPLFLAEIRVKDGGTVKLPVKVQRGIDGKGNETLIVYISRKSIIEENAAKLGFTPIEIGLLKWGDPIQKAIGPDRVMHYAQLDPETNGIMLRNATEVKLEEKVREMEKINDIELGTQQKQQIREGKPVELNVGGEKVSVGVDLKEPEGFKIVQGDMAEWKRQKAIAYDIEHPEYVGLVHTERNRWEYQKVIDARSQTLSPEQRQEANQDLKRKTGMSF